MLSTVEMSETIEAYKVLIVTRNAMIAQAKADRQNGLVARLKKAQREDWITVGELRNKINNKAREGEKV